MKRGSGLPVVSSEPPAHGGPSLYEQLFQTAADALVVVDASGRIRMANRQAERLFGYSGIELRELSVEDLIPQRFRDSHQHHRRNYERHPASRPMGMNLALWALNRDGEEFPVEVSLSPFRVDEQVLVSANIRDVSELHRAREVLTHARQSSAIVDFGRLALSTDVPTIQREACRLAALNLDVPQALLLRRESGRQELAVAASSGFERIPGSVDEAARERLVAAIAERFPADPAGIHEEAASFDVPAQAGGEAAHLLLCTIPGEEHGAGLLAACAGAGRSFTRHESSFLQALANTVGAVLQRDHTEERLFQSQRLEALGQLTGGVAHDFNNLLTVVSGNLQMLDERLESDPLSGKLVKSALRATGRGADLTRKLLAFSRRQTLQPRAIDIGQLLGSLADILRRTLGARIEVRTVIEDALPLVKADPGMLDTALLNLAVNSRDAMPAGGRLTFEAQLEMLDADYAARETEVVPGEYVRIAISDSGTGMSPAVLSRAFEPFFTTKERGKGSGLGLSLVYGFVKQSGGHIKVYSEPGIGTAIKLYLPTAGDQALRPPESSVEQMRGGHEAILVVEDDEAVREVAVGFVARLGYRVLQAASAEEALAQLAREPDIALLFTDVVLRGEVNGPELAREAQRRHPGLQVLFTSGYARNALPPRSGLDGSIELLGKPYRIADLARMLRRALDRAQLAGRTQAGRAPASGKRSGGRPAG